MSEAVLLSSGDHISDVTIGGYSLGQVVPVYGSRIVGVVHRFGANEPLILLTRGRFLVTKDNSTIAKGATVYWDNAARKATATNTGVILGLALAAASTTDSQVEVFLNA